MTAVTGGKRAGDREKARFRPELLVHLAGMALAFAAWAYLVLAAIDFGATARHEGKATAWVLLVVAALGAMGCLFLAFMLAARFSRALGLTSGPEPRVKRDPNAPKGGKRAAR
jgi:hypothetical protein